jgi:hypothetical protein
VRLWASPLENNDMTDMTAKTDMTDMTDKRTRPSVKPLIWMRAGTATERNIEIRR